MGPTPRLASLGRALRAQRLLDRSRRALRAQRLLDRSRHALRAQRLLDRSLGRALRAWRIESSDLGLVTG